MIKLPVPSVLLVTVSPRLSWRNFEKLAFCFLLSWWHRDLRRMYRKNRCDLRGKPPHFESAASAESPGSPACYSTTVQGHFKLTYLSENEVEAIESTSLITNEPRVWAAAITEIQKSLLATPITEFHMPSLCGRNTSSTYTRADLDCHPDISLGSR
jgi:hypothetical protein